MNIDWSLLLLVVVGIVFVIGLIILLQSARGRTGLSNAALRLAEALIAYAIRWLEGHDDNQGAAIAPDHARIALAALRARRAKDAG